MKTIFSAPEPRFGGKAVQVVRHAAARAMRLRVDPRDGAVRLTLPPRASLRRAYAWVEEQRGWIEGQLARVPAGVRLVPGAVIEVGGERVTLVQPSPLASEGRGESLLANSAFADLAPPPMHEVRMSPGHPQPCPGDRATSCILPTRGRGLRRVGDSLIVPGDPALFEARVLRWLKAEARRVLDVETRALAARVGVTVARVSVGDTRSRWGSCSASGDIRYSWRLILAPVFVRQATVAHEVAHRVHMNHGPAFKALERELIGGSPAAARAWLRAHGASLHGYGRN